MKDINLDKAFEEIKNELSINNDLKKELRKSFIKKRRPGIWKKVIAVAAAAAVISVALLIPNNGKIERVSAAALNIQNHISFVDIGNGQPLGVSEYNGTLYMPISGKGIFSYDKQGFARIFNEDTYFIRVSPDGKQLTFSSNGSLKIYDLASKKVNEILKGDGSETYYEEPSWADSNTILYTKRIIQFNDTHGYTVKESGIYSLNLKTMNSVKLTDGEHPSYVKGSDAVAFVRDGKVMILNLKNKSEKVVDNGKYPSVSLDGRYIAYVKTKTTSKEAGENAKVEETTDDIWIADTADLSVTKKLTANYPFYFINPDEWAKGLEPSNLPQVLSISGNYSYYEPVWSSNSESIYAVKGSNTGEANGSNMRVMRIDLAPKVVSPGDTVRRFLQALIARDDDYAKSLMKNPPEVLTISNPHPVGYRIIGEGTENGKHYADAEVYWSYTASAYFQAIKSRYYLTTNSSGYIMDSIREDESTEVYEREGSVYMSQGDNKEVIFKESDLPEEYIGNGRHRFSSLAYYPDSDSILFTVQSTGSDSGNTDIKVMSYNRKDRSFRLIDDVKAGNGVNDMGAASLTIDSTGNYAALDIFTQSGELFGSSTYVYDLKTNERKNLATLFSGASAESLNTSFWDESRLVFTVTVDEQNVKYIYDPETGGKNSF